MPFVITELKTRLREKIHRCEMLEGFSRELLNLLQSGRTNDLGPVLLRKTELIREMDRIDQTLPSLKNLPLPCRKEISSELQALHSLLHRISGNEREAIVIAEKLKGDVGDQIQRLRQGSRAFKGYHPGGASPSARFLDIRH